jgi:hypothetical protein
MVNGVIKEKVNIFPRVAFLTTSDRPDIDSASRENDADEKISHT